MPSDSDLYESLDSALASLGFPTRNLVLSVIESRHISFRPDSVDLKSVDRVLIELFGIGSRAIIDLARRRLDSKMLIGFDESRVADPVEKIRMWLEINRSRERRSA
jgi:hypothetical protein